MALTEVLVQPPMQVGRWPLALWSLGGVEIKPGHYHEITNTNDKIFAAAIGTVIPINVCIIF